MKYSSSRLLSKAYNKPHSYITKAIRDLESQERLLGVIHSSYRCTQNKQIYNELFIRSTDLVILLEYWSSRNPKRVRKSKLSRSKKLAVKTKDGFLCVKCSSSDDLCVDHKLPECKGGDNSMENLQTLCRSCNSSKGTKTMKEWEAVK